jgi:hypothetical protein
MARQVDQRKCSEWQQRLRRFEKSGLTVARFCARGPDKGASHQIWISQATALRRSPRFSGEILYASRFQMRWTLTTPSPSAACRFPCRQPAKAR